MRAGVKEGSGFIRLGLRVGGFRNRALRFEVFCIRVRFRPYANSEELAGEVDRHEGRLEVFSNEDSWERGRASSEGAGCMSCPVLSKESGQLMHSCAARRPSRAGHAGLVVNVLQESPLPSDGTQVD